MPIRLSRIPVPLLTKALAVPLLALAAGPFPGRSDAAEIPQEARQALERNATALSPLTVAWERKRSSSFQLSELLERLGPGESNQGFFLPYRVRLWRDRDHFRTYFSFSYWKKGMSPGETHSE